MNLFNCRVNILVSNIRPYLKKIWFANKSGGTSNDVVVIRAKENVEPRFLSFILKNENFIDYVMKGAKGVKMPRGDIALMTKYQITYPPIPEQQKVADCLSSLDDLITAENKKLDALKTHKKGLMQQLFPAEGETVPRLRFPEFSGEWEEKSLGSIGTFTGGGTPSKNSPHYWVGTNPWVSSSDIDDESIQSISITRFISDEAIQESATKVVPANSILLVSRVGVGKLAISRKPICTSQDFTSLTPTKDNLVFLAYCMKSLKKAFLAFNQGMAIKGFTKEDVSSLNIYLPQLAEQQKIADFLSSVDELISAQIKKIDALKTHKKGLMQQLFPVLSH